MCNTGPAVSSTPVRALGGVAVTEGCLSSASPLAKSSTSFLALSSASSLNLSSASLTLCSASDVALSSALFDLELCFHSDLVFSFAHGGVVVLDQLVMKLDGAAVGAGAVL